MIGQETSIVVMNSGLKDLSNMHLESTLSLSRAHLKRLVGLGSTKSSEEIDSRLLYMEADDVLNYKIKRFPILFAAAVKQLNALRDIVYESSQVRVCICI
jgi:hypothetical protein